VLQLYNDLTQQREPFIPRERTVSLYVCGITPYDTTHLGHAFTYCSFDVLVRYLEWLGLTVRYVQNVTDIDDDILRKAREVGEDWLALGNRWVRHFINDMEALNVRPPTFYPRASDVIPQMVRTIELLVSRGYAYVRAGSVYYRAQAAPFGLLSRLSQEEWLHTAAQRGGNPQDVNKEHPLDFVLWQAQAAGEPAWPSPWGPGRPGWHIECSTISAIFLGPTVDIHGGGADLAFPHHECEIAQSEAATGERPFVRYWLHTGMVYYQGEKMSKSLGNIIMMHDLLSRFNPDALRLYLASHHYREPWAYDLPALEHSAIMAQRWRAAAYEREAQPGAGPTPVRGAFASACRLPSLEGDVACTGALSQATNQAAHAFAGAMASDLNAPAAIRVLDDLANAILASGGQQVQLAPAQALLRRLAGLLGLRLDRVGPEPRVIAGWQEHKARFPAPELAAPAS